MYCLYDGVVQQAPHLLAKAMTDFTVLLRKLNHNKRCDEHGWMTEIIAKGEYQHITHKLTHVSWKNIELVSSHGPEAYDY